jgi:hypothetical protein
VPVAAFSHPPRTAQMAFPRTAGAFGLSCRVDVEHDPRHLGPIGSIAFCVEEA